MVVAAISVAAAVGGAVAVMPGTAVTGGVEVGIEVVGMDAAGPADLIGMAAADTGMVVLPSGGGITLRVQAWWLVRDVGSRRRRNNALASGELRQPRHPSKRTADGRR
jgi:hypothetical protein